MDTTAETICRAISNRHRLAFMCSEEMCVVEPHQLGRTPNGDFVLLAYHVEGKPGSAGTAHGEEERWRVYRVADFYWALESGDAFEGPRPEYERVANGAIAIVVCRL